MSDTNLEWGIGTGGGTAGINSVRFYACPLCGACVMDYEHNAYNRLAHEASHGEEDA